jgi:guanylate kinase
MTSADRRASVPTTSPALQRRGLLLVISSPSGAGKTTLARRLLAAEPALEMSVSVTTRAPRPGEVDGRDYHFVDQADFAKLRDEGRLLEWAEVFANRYGTPKEPVMEALAAGRDVLFDIDWQGARQLAEQARGDLATVFILPPSAAALSERLATRGQDTPEVIARRMAAAAAEISHWPEYDYVVVNEDVARAEASLRAILAAERARRQRQVGLNDFARALQAGLGG